MAELQDKRAPFEPRGGPGMGKDKHQAGQMGLNPPPLWYRAPVICLSHIGDLGKNRSELPVKKANNRRTQPGVGQHPN